MYISFITDAFSRKIVGYHVAQTLETVETIQALKMALSGLSKEPDSHFQLIHHSDRGVQYCSHDYVKLLQDYHIQISMTENGDPLENAIAERLNGILKDEYLTDRPVKSIHEARTILAKAVYLYNDDPVAPFPDPDRGDAQSTARGGLLDGVHGLSTITHRQHLTSLIHTQYSLALP